MAWTDSNLNTTIKIRSIHIIELRGAIEALENSCGAHDATYKSSNNSTYYSTQYSSVQTSRNSAIYTGNYSKVYTMNNGKVCGHVVGVHNQTN